MSHGAVKSHERTAGVEALQRGLTAAISEDAMEERTGDL